MRNELKKIIGQRVTFTATVDKFGTKTNFKGYPEQTILFKMSDS
jgi:hypothetical protein